MVHKEIRWLQRNNERVRERKGGPCVSVSGGVFFLFFNNLLPPLPLEFEILPTLQLTFRWYCQFTNFDSQSFQCLNFNFDSGVCIYSERKMNRIAGKEVDLTLPPGVLYRHVNLHVLWPVELTLGVTMTDCSTWLVTLNLLMVKQILFHMPHHHHHQHYQPNYVH